MSLKAKILVTITSVLCILCIAVISVILYFTTFKISGASISSEPEYSYQCSTFDDAVSASNRGSLNYYNSNLSSRDIIFLSPISIQGTLYTTIDTDTPSLFKNFENGYSSWSQSSRLFDDKCFATIPANSVSSTDELVGMLNNISNGFISSLSKDIDFSSRSVFNVFSYSAVFNNAVYDDTKSVIFLDDAFLYKKTDEYEAIKIRCKDNKYSIYFVDGDLQSFSFDDFTFKKLRVGITPYIWQVVGEADNLVDEFTSDYIDLKVVQQFGYDFKSYPIKKVKKSDDIIFFAQDYSVVLVNEENKLIIGVGCR